MRTTGLVGLLAWLSLFSGSGTGRISAEPQTSPEIIVIPDPADDSIIRPRRTTPSVLVLGATPLLVTNGLVAPLTVPFVFTNALGVRLTNFAVVPLTNALGALTNPFIAPATNLAAGPLTNAVPPLPGNLAPPLTSPAPPLSPTGRQPIVAPLPPPVVPPLRPAGTGGPAFPPLRSPTPATPPTVPALPPGSAR